MCWVLPLCAQEAGKSVTVDQARAAALKGLAFTEKDGGELAGDQEVRFLPPEGHGRVDPARSVGNKDYFTFSLSHASTSDTLKPEGPGPPL